jgi:type VI secretion system secreted protein Hcp
MSRSFVSQRARSLALVLTALLLAALAFAVISPRSNTLNTGAATAGVVHIEMKITGQKTGVFKGDSTQKGHADQIVLSSYLFQVSSPRDVGSGLPTGRRVYQPLSVTKLLNQSSPQVLNALVTNENLKSVVINFWETTRTGTEVNFYRVTLTNANISADKQFTNGSTVSEEISFVFQKIEQQSLTGGTIFEDDFGRAA